MVQSQTSPKRSSRRFISAVLLFGLLAVLLIVYEHLAIYDWLRLRNYQPASEIASIASDDGLTPKATHIFYVNHPVIEQKPVFAQVCPNGTKETAVLGCYIPNQRGIYVLSVTDTRLEGIEQVTAAHEMLHAAYDRLSPSKKQQVNDWLTAYYATLTDKTIRDQIDSYKKTEPNDLVNEMHSIIGTEVATLPSDLETYYEQYFSDRSKVVAQYSNYTAVFTSLKNQSNDLLAQINSLKSQIEALNNELAAEYSSLNKTRGNVKSQQDVDTFNSKVNNYNAKVDYVNGLVAQYKELVNEYNQTVVQLQQLNSDISSATPIGSQ